ncbi:MAG: hypothetical protein SWH61_13240 [Thermodesulfobacteriota bacterium]|nr:hypothetical protein [Thermodesulfobacteriota bacterium]
MSMFRSWIPWRVIIRRAAKAHGFIDPISLMARLRQFAQPSEVQEPIELLRAGIIFHARGLVNAKAIQHNLDWIWPYWVEKQFNPASTSFIPRAFSISHINLTHRNWTAVGIPDSDAYPIVDPRGLVTPFFDSWSMDFWLMNANSRMLIPSRSNHTSQELIISPNLEIITTTTTETGAISSRVRLERTGEANMLRITVTVRSEKEDCLWVSIRPYNPEGIQFIEKIQAVQLPKGPGMLVNNSQYIYFDQPPSDTLFANYREGDVIHQFQNPDRPRSVQCDVGMATAAAVFPTDKGNGTRTIDIRISVETATETAPGPTVHKDTAASWTSALNSTSELQIPDRRITFLYNAAVRTLVLLSAKQIVPGPYTYKRFWYRDACLMMHALLVTGFEERCRQHLNAFPNGQKATGYFQSQAGEWDSNGQVLWIADRFQQLTNSALDDTWKPVIRKAVRWIDRKRLTRKQDTRHAGLLPAGFSAEHLGTNDYYYWDDFWAIAGLQGAARTMQRFGDMTAANAINRLADDLKSDVEKSVAAIPEKQKRGCLPASPYRRMDAGAIGSLVADYPLDLYPIEDDPATGASVTGTTMLHTARFLIKSCFHEGGFFQDMIHSGINPYLTLCIAQTLLRYGDARFRDLVTTVAGLASPTGQWPEAIHPITKGGCMGDGQHGWAAAEWVMMIRNMFVREEGDKLIIGSGIFPEWLKSQTPLGFGPTLTPLGPMHIQLTPEGRRLALTVQLTGKSRTITEKPSGLRITARVPGYQPADVPALDKPLLLKPE